MAISEVLLFWGETEIPLVVPNTYTFFLTGAHTYVGSTEYMICIFEVTQQVSDMVYIYILLNTCFFNHHHPIDQCDGTRKVNSPSSSIWISMLKITMSVTVALEAFKNVSY